MTRAFVWVGKKQCLAWLGREPRKGPRRRERRVDKTSVRVQMNETDEYVAGKRDGSGGMR